jgi:hypothetical protein
MDLTKLKAIDVHVHAEVRAMIRKTRSWAGSSTRPRNYFKTERKRPTIPETVAIYRERRSASSCSPSTWSRDRDQAHLQRGDRRGGARQ